MAKKKRIRKVVIVLGVLLVLAVAGVALIGPSIASGIARGVIARLGSRAIAGTVEVGSVSLSWTGSQRVQGLRVLDVGGQQVASLNASLDAGILALALGSRDLGEIRLSGSARVERNAEGELTILGATLPASPAPSTPQSAEPARIPKGLKARVRIEGFDLEIVDADGSSTIKGLAGETQVRVGEPITLNLKTSSIEHAGRSGGSLGVNASVSNWSSAEGEVTPDAATIDASVDMTDLPSGLVRALAGVEINLNEAFGETLSLTTRAQGTQRDINASIDFRAQRASLVARVRVGEDAISLSEPLVASAGVMGLARSLPGMGETIAEAEKTFRLSGDPSVTLRVESLRVPRTEGGVALDRASVLARVEVPASGGTLIVEGREHAIALAPTTAEISLTPENGLVASAGGSATMDQREAGRFEARAALADLFDDTGGLSIDAEGVQGFVALRGFDVALAQPFLESVKVDLNEAIGPTLDARIEVAPAGGGRLATLDVSAQRAKAGGTLLIADNHVRSSDRPLTFSMNAEPGLVNALLGETPEFVLTRGGTLEGTIAGVDVNLRPPEGESPIDSAKAEVDITLRGFAGRLKRTNDDGTPAPAGTPIGLDRGTIRATLAGANAASGAIDLSFSRGQERFGVGINLASVLLAPLREGRYVASGLRASAALRDLPLSLIDDLGITMQGEDGSPISLRDLARESVGEALSASLDLTPSGESIAVAGSVASREIAGRLTGSLDDRSLRIDSINADGTIRPRAFEAFVGAFAPTLDPSPRLAGKTAYHARVQPFSIDLASPGAPESLAMTLTLDRADLRQIGIAVADESGKIERRTLGPLLVDSARAEVILAMGTSSTIKGGVRVLDEGEKPLASLELSASSQTDKATSGTLALRALQTAVADRLLDNPGLVSGALGEGVDADVTFRILPSGPTVLDVSFTAPRARTPRPFRVTMHEDRIETNKIAANWDLSAVWANAELFEGGEVRLARDARVWLEIEPTILPAEGSSAPIRTDMNVLIGYLGFESASGPGDAFNDLRVRLRSDDSRKDVVLLTASAARGQAKDVLKGDGELRLARTPDGAFDPETSILDLTASISNVRVALVDALTAQGGMLTDLVGETASARLVAEDLSKDTGVLHLNLDSPRTTVALKCRVRDGVMRVRPARDGEPAQLRIASFPPELGGRISKAVPLIGKIEKSPQDDPAQIRISRLELPLDGDLRKLNANLTIDLGTANFQASELFTPVLSQLSWNAGGPLGRRLAPITLQVRDGVMDYNNLTLPLGEFSLRLDGKADLADRSIETIVHVPFAALSKNFGADIQGQVARVLGPLGVAPDMSKLAVPLRVRGSMESPSLGLATDQFVESLRRSFTPEDLLKRGLGDALKGLGGGG